MRSKHVISLLVVAIAFLLATNPVVAGAAKQITGKQIKNNTVAGKDVKNRSLTGKDLKDGAVGPADLTSATISRLGTRVYEFRLPASAQVNVISRSWELAGVPRGTYTFDYSVHAKMNGAGGVLGCGMVLGPPSPDTPRAGWQQAVNAAGVGALSAGGAIRVGSDAPRLACGMQTGGATSYGIADPADGLRPSSVVLTRVDHITTADVE